MSKTHTVTATQITATTTILLSEEEAATILAAHVMQQQSPELQSHLSAIGRVLGEGRHESSIKSEVHFDTGCDYLRGITITLTETWEESR